MVSKATLGFLSLMVITAVVGCSMQQPAQPPASTTAPYSISTEVSASAPATFQMEWLRISPAVVYPGDRVTITANVVNTGNIDDQYSVELKINSIVDQVAEVTIGAGKSQSFSLFIWNDEPGTYDVTLGELSGQFVIVKPSAPKPVVGPPAAPGGNAVPSCCQ